MMSSRHVPVLCVLVALALVPAVIHSYAGGTVDDGRSTAAVPTALAGFIGAPSDRHETWGRRRFDSDDWTERRYVAGGSEPGRSPAEAILTIVRSFDLKALYHHPELAVAYGQGFVSHRVVRPAARPDLPVHELRGAGDADRPAGFYVLHYDDRFVEFPIRFQIEVAGRLLISPRQPMTLFFLLVPDAPQEASIDDLDATRLLTAAIDHFVSQAP